MLTMMRWLSAAAVAFALLAAGCGGTTSQIGSGASILVPASAPAFLAVDTDPTSGQWQEIDALASKFPDKQKAVDSIKRDLGKHSIDWTKDVKPALGKELDLAWLDFENNGQNVVGLLQPTDTAKFKELVKRANASEKDPSNRVVYRSFRGWEVLASKKETIDRFVKASVTEDALANKAAFKQSMQRLGGDSLVRAYVNGAFLTKLARTYGGDQVQPYLDKAGTLDWIALRLGATSKGVGLDAIVHGTPGTLFKGVPASSAFSPKLLGTVPQDALLYLTFHGSKNMFADLEKNSLLAKPQYRQLREPLHQLGRVLEGENALYVRPGTARSPGVGFAIPEVTLVATPGHGTDGSSILDRLVRKYAPTAVPEVRYVDGTPVHVFASGGGAGLYYANVKGKLVVTDQVGGIRGVSSGKPLSQSAEFKDAASASGLPGKTYGFLYVDIHSTVPLVEKLSQSKIPADVARNLKPLRSAVEYAVSHSHEFQVTFFLRLK
jgi:Protein of unknown function (DUF3352)